MLRAARGAVYALLDVQCQVCGPGGVIPPAVPHCGPTLTCLSRRAQRDFDPVRKPGTGVASEPKGAKRTPGVCEMHPARNRRLPVPQGASRGLPSDLRFLKQKVQPQPWCEVNTPATRAIAGALNKAHHGA